LLTCLWLRPALDVLIWPQKLRSSEALVETDWLAQHLKDDGIRIVESNEDILLYGTGHIPAPFT